MIDINHPIFEPKLALLQLQVERVYVHGTAFGEPRLGITPEPFYAVDVAACTHKISDSMINSQMLRATQVDKSIIGATAVAVDDAIQAVFATYEDFSRSFCPGHHVREFLWPPSSEVGFVDFEMTGKRGLVLAVFGDSSAYEHKVGVYCVSTQAGQFGDLFGAQIQA